MKYCDFKKPKSVPFCSSVHFSVLIFPSFPLTKRAIVVIHSLAPAYSLFSGSSHSWLFYQPWDGYSSSNSRAHRNDYFHLFNQFSISYILYDVVLEQVFFVCSEMTLHPTRVLAECLTHLRCIWKSQPMLFALSDIPSSASGIPNCPD